MVDFKNGTFDLHLNTSRATQVRRAAAPLQAESETFF